MGELGFSVMCGTFSGPRPVVDLAAELDAAGHDHIFITESGNDAFATLGAMAARTSRARIGSAIAMIYPRHPWAVANAAAAIDSLSGGRLVLGLGTGHQPTVEARLGMDFRKPVSRMRDYITVVRESLETRTGPTETRTEHYQNVGFPQIWPPAGRVPIVVAALGDPMVKMAATHSDGIMTSLASKSQMRRFRQLVDETAAAAGRPPGSVKIYAVMHAVIRDDQQEAREIMREGLGYSRMPLYQREFEREGMSAPGGRPDDATIEAISIAGPPSYAREQIAEWFDCGVDVLLLADTYNTPDATAEYRTLARLIESMR